MKRRLLGLLALPGLGACHLFDHLVDPSCIAKSFTLYTPAIVATVTDSVTGQAAATGAVGIAQRPGLVDTMVANTASTLITTVKADTGTYSVTITKSGYSAWTAQNVAVKTGSCGVITTTLTPRLQP